LCDMHVAVAVVAASVVQVAVAVVVARAETDFNAKRFGFKCPRPAVELIAPTTTALSLHQ
jgi:hypothetical protein